MHEGFLKQTTVLQQMWQIKLSKEHSAEPISVGDNVLDTVV